MTSTRSAAAPGLHISRADLEHLIEEAIAALDLLDGDVDLEDNGDLEPSLGHYMCGIVDGEEECEDEGAQCDDEGHGDVADREYTLGAPEAGFGPNRGWAESQSGSVDDGDADDSAFEANQDLPHSASFELSSSRRPFRMASCS